MEYYHKTDKNHIVNHYKMSFVWCNFLPKCILHYLNA